MFFKWQLERPPSQTQPQIKDTVCSTWAELTALNVRDDAETMTLGNGVKRSSSGGLSAHLPVHNPNLRRIETECTARDGTMGLNVLDRFLRKLQQNQMS